MLLHREFFKELRELLREGVSMLKMFMNGRYIRGVEEVVNLDETGRLKRILNWAWIERGVVSMVQNCGRGRDTFHIGRGFV